MRNVRPTKSASKITLEKCAMLALDPTGCPFLQLNDSEGRPRLELNVTADGDPHISLYNEKNVNVLSIGISSAENSAGMTIWAKMAKRCTPSASMKAATSNNRKTCPATNARLPCARAWTHPDWSGTHPDPSRSLPAVSLSNRSTARRLQITRAHSPRACQRFLSSSLSTRSSLAQRRRIPRLQ